MYYTKADFSVGQHVLARAGLFHHHGTITVMKDSTAVIREDNTFASHEYPYENLTPDSGESVPVATIRDDDETITPFVAGIATGIASDDEVPIPDSPFEGGGGVSAGGGAESSFDAPDTSSSPDFSNVESGSSSTADTP